MSTAVITRIHSTPVGVGSSVGRSVAIGEQSRLRITRRGQFVLTVAVALPVVFFALASALNGGEAVATDSAVSHSFQHVTVEAGESLWQLAGQIAPHADPRVVVADIAQLNQLDSATVQPGQSIAIPQQYEK